MGFIRNMLKFAAAGIFTAFLSATTVFAGSTAVISGDNVNVRIGPDLNSNVVKQYNSGETLDIISYKDGWYEIKDDSLQAGTSYYVFSEFVIIVQMDATVNANDVNIRSGPSTDDMVLGKKHKGDVISVTGKEGTFYSFDMGGETGYIFDGYVEGEFLAYVQEQETTTVMRIPPTVEPVNKMSEPTYAIVKSSSGVNMRKGPSTSDELIFPLPYDDIVDVLESSGEWSRVSYGGIEGYIKTEFLSLHTGQKPDRSLRTTKANALINFAKKYLGTRYVWGGTNLSKGVDCSGFVYSVFKNFGYSLNRTSRDQAKNGTKVSRSDLLPGDLVFFNASSGGAISHVGIYIGGGQFIHSSSSKSKSGVKISSLSESYYNSRYYTATRIFN